MAERVNTTNLKDGSHAYPTEHITKLDTKDKILISAFCLIFFIGVFGNLLVCYIFKFKTRKRLSTMEKLILYLAVADLVSSITNPTMFIYWTVTKHKAWHFGDVGCKILPSLTRITVSFTIGIILIITIDRCRVICQPFEAQFKHYHIVIAISVTFVLSVMSDLPYTIYQEVNPLSTCQVPNTEIPGFAYPIISIYILRDIFFVLIFSISTYFIYRELYEEEHLQTLQNQNHLKKTKRVMIMLITMAILFTLLVFPRDILHVSFMISWLSPPGIPYTKAFLDINSFLKILHMCNSICNPFIYARLHGNFRRRLIRLTKSLFYGEQFNETLAEERTQSFAFVHSMYPDNNNDSISQPVRFRLTRHNKEIIKNKDKSLTTVSRDIYMTAECKNIYLTTNNQKIYLTAEFKTYNQCDTITAL